MINDNEINQKRRQNRSLAGIILVAAGAAYLLQQLNFLMIPYWVFSWPMALIAIGILSGLKHNFRNMGWFYMVLIGGLFLINYIIPTVHIVFFWPVIMIAIGVRLLFLRDNRWCRDRWERRHEWRNDMHDNPGYTSL